MDITQALAQPDKKAIFCVEMHTCGEPTRIVFRGYPDLKGTLLEQRNQAKTQYDHIRKRLILEPRGHYDMYGAILRPDTELTENGEAHMGVLFLTNDGYSTMCGHATIALGRFLYDTVDLSVFPRRRDIDWDRDELVAYINLHAPCGLLRVKVPVNAHGSASDPNRPVSFVSVPSFASGVDVPIKISNWWPQLGSRDGTEVSIEADFAYGGAFYVFIPARSLGFEGNLQDVDMRELNKATECLLKDIRSQSELSKYYQHPGEPDLSFLYGAIVTDQVLREGKPVTDAELGVCFFADQQIDRSPTGSGVAARVALAYAKGNRQSGVPWAYHSLVSNRGLGPPFVGIVESETGTAATRREAQVQVRVEGQAFYTGFNVLSVEPEDLLGDSGFVFTKIQK